MAACLFGAYGLYAAFVVGQGGLAWAAVLDAVMLIGGVQLICIGVIGEYLGVIHEESKRRPLYVIREVLE